MNALILMNLLQKENSFERIIPPMKKEIEENISWEFLYSENSLLLEHFIHCLPDEEFKNWCFPLLKPFIFDTDDKSVIWKCLESYYASKILLQSIYHLPDEDVFELYTHQNEILSNTTVNLLENNLTSKQILSNILWTYNAFVTRFIYSDSEFMKHNGNTFAVESLNRLYSFFEK